MRPLPILASLAALLWAPALDARRHAPPAASAPASITPAATGDPSHLRGAAQLSAAMLSVHNAARAAVGTPPLSWDQALAADAAAWAQVLAREGAMRHDPAPDRREPEGENLWQGSTGTYPYAAMAEGWAGERRYFVNRPSPNFSTTGRWQDVAHYSQMVWRTTRRIGCAVASNARDDFLVCRYAGPGNWDGEKAY